MPINILVIIIFCSIILLILIIGIPLKIFYFHSIERLQNYKINIDLTNKRIKSNDNGYIKKLEEEIISKPSYYLNLKEQTIKKIKQWESDELKSINNSHLLSKRKLFYKNKLSQIKKKLIDTYFEISFTRIGTRYKQYNYVKYPYQYAYSENTMIYSFSAFFELVNKLKKIGFETTLEDYNSKNQRRLLTKELRLKVMERDNYTCQICGKYMPDGVGLQIDHIIPVSKGGKTVMSNLRVLCSKCNGKKGDK